MQLAHETSEVGQYGGIILKEIVISADSLPNIYRMVACIRGGERKGFTCSPERVLLLLQITIMPFAS